MTGGLAHEIKNPLSTIGLNAQLIREGIQHLKGADPGERDRLIRRVDVLHRESERLGSILTEFLEFAGQIRLEPAPADLNEVAEELVDFFTPQARSAGVRLRLEPASEPVRLEIDVGHLKQAALNLMLNAVQAMRAAGEDQEKELLLRVETARQRGGEAAAILHVIDTGPGIPQETLDRVFTPYFSTRSGGTGLGLPLSRRIAEAHGGTLEVHSTVGVGTDCAITVPLKAASDRGGAA